MSEEVHIPSEGTLRRYYAAVPITDALAVCRDLEELSKALAMHLSEFLSFDHLDVALFREDSNEIEQVAWGRGPLPLPDLPAEEMRMWHRQGDREPLHIPEWSSDGRFPYLKAALAAKALGAESIGPVIRVALVTPQRRVGTLGIAGPRGTVYSAEDIGFLCLIARMTAIAIDAGLGVSRAQKAQTDLKRQNDRIQLLLDLTSRITSNLDLREVLRAVASNVREVMQCDVAGICLPEETAGTFRVFALDFPQGKGFAKEDLLATPAANAPVKKAFETLKPVIVRTADTVDVSPQAYEMSVAEGVKSLCVIPLVNRGRAVGVIVFGRRSDDLFTPEDTEFVSKAGSQIAIAIENALAYREISELKDKLAQEKLYLEQEIRSEGNYEQIVGNSDALRELLQLVETVAPSDSTVLLLGETGTGKELVARAIHDRSRRSSSTFVKLNCAAIPTGLLESELFGHEKGAFTGAVSQKVGRMELADQGTLFLDEVGDIPAEIQPKLLRALQEREFERLGSTITRRVNIRLVAATNRDLEQMVANREFRSDLFYRLNVFPIRIPPLRDRREDIPLLVSYFVQKFADQMQKKIESIPTAVMKGLIAWEWPGNIRELENFIERAVILTRGSSLEAPISGLRKVSSNSVSATPEPGQEDIARIVKETIAALKGNRDLSDEHSQKQREEIIRALKESKGRVAGADGAAARMGINRSTLITRIKKFGIDPRQYA
ncbi:sigma 54-interacting transcriptional regulator [Edaphobacter sp. HDX4]|uniref:sigma 54-interacting transcriptional regulator n=1 Tax=Edaphobacter sp. HDX4 TaxID=2794064 RepID=UPI002FE5C944